MNQINDRLDLDALEQAVRLLMAAEDELLAMPENDRYLTPDTETLGWVVGALAGFRVHSDDDVDELENWFDTTFPGLLDE